MRAARTYAPLDGRLKAASACRANGWVVGTWLNSTEDWNGPRRIVSFDGGTSEFVKLSGGYRVMILPADVHEVPAPALIPRCKHSRKLSDPCPYCGRENPVNQ